MLRKKNSHKESESFNEPTPNSLQELPKGKSAVVNPSRIIISGFVVIILFFGVMGVWASVSKITGAVVGPGKVKIEKERKTIQHLEGGIVDKIFVSEGAKVEAGETLILLESSQIEASLDMLRKQLYGLLAKQSRLIAQKEMSETIEWVPELQDNSQDPAAIKVISSEQKVFEAKRDNLMGQIDLLKAQIEQVRSQIDGFKDRADSETTIINITKEELEAKTELFENRYLEKSQIMDLQRMLASHQANKSSALQEIAEAKEKEVELFLKITSLKNNYIETASEQLAEVANKIIEIKERIRPLLDAKQRLAIKAPVSGVVVGLKVHSEDGVIKPGAPIMDIVPENHQLIVETEIQVQDIADVYIGQKGQVQLDAFDRRTTPPMPATVNYISADRMEEKSGYGVRAYYIVHLELDQQAVDEAGVYLSPGMPATVFITTKDRTIMDYLLEPLVKNFELALRE